MEVRVDGPYGEESARPKWANYEVLIIFAGGIGVRLHHKDTLMRPLTCKAYNAACSGREVFGLSSSVEACVNVQRFTMGVLRVSAYGR